MFCLFAAEKGYDSDRPVGKLFVCEDRADLVCDRLRFAIIPVVRIAHPTLYIDIDERWLDTFGSSRNAKGQNLILIEHAIRVRDNWRHTSEVLAQHDLVCGEDASRKIV